MKKYIIIWCVFILFILLDENIRNYLKDVYHFLLMGVVIEFLIFHNSGVIKNAKKKKDRK